MKAYDAGLLNDFGGGDVDWWQDYIRAELERAHEFYAAEIERLSATQSSHTDLLEAAKQVLDRMSSTYRARNGREMGIQGDDGEKCWIVHSDDIEALERAVDAIAQHKGQPKQAGNPDHNAPMVTQW